MSWKGYDKIDGSWSIEDVLNWVHTGRSPRGNRNANSNSNSNNNNNNNTRPRRPTKNNMNSNNSNSNSNSTTTTTTTTTVRATQTQTTTIVKIKPKSAQNLVFFNQQTTNNKQQTTMNFEIQALGGKLIGSRSAMKTLDRLTTLLPNAKINFEVIPPPETKKAEFGSMPTLRPGL